MNPVTATVVIGSLAGAQGALSFAQADQQNKRVKSSLRSSAEAAAAKTGQLKDAARLDSVQTSREADRARARARVLAAAGGRGEDTSLLDIISQSTADEGLNLSTIGTNLTNNTRAVNSGAKADQAQIAGQYQNPLLATVMGLLQGAQQGIMIAGGVNSLYGSSSTSAPSPMGTYEDFVRAHGGTP